MYHALDECFHRGQTLLAVNAHQSKLRSIISFSRLLLLVQDYGWNVVVLYGTLFSIETITFN
jgi:hypothetical protein